VKGYTQIILRLFDGKLKGLDLAWFFMTPYIASTCRGFLEGCRETRDKLMRDMSHV